MGACMYNKAVVEERRNELDNDITGDEPKPDYDFKPIISTECNRPPLNKSELGKINDFSDGFFKAYNQIRRTPKNYMALADEFGISNLFRGASGITPSAPNIDYYDTAKEKIIKIFDEKKDKSDIIEELKNCNEYNGLNVDVYFGRIELIPRPSRNDEWMDYCRKGVCDIFSRYAQDDINLLTKPADYATFICVIDELKSVVNTVMVTFNSN